MKHKVSSLFSLVFNVFDFAQLTEKRLFRCERGTRLPFSKAANSRIREVKYLSRNFNFVLIRNPAWLTRLLIYLIKLLIFFMMTRGASSLENEISTFEMLTTLASIVTDVFHTLQMGLAMSLRRIWSQFFIFPIFFKREQHETSRMLRSSRCNSYEANSFWKSNDAVVNGFSNTRHARF